MQYADHPGELVDLVLGVLQLFDEREVVAFFATDLDGEVLYSVVQLFEGLVVEVVSLLIDGVLQLLLLHQLLDAPD